MAHQRQDETKQPSPPPSTETTNTLTTTSDMYLSTHLIVPYFITASGEIKRPEHLIAWWSRIFSFLYVPDDKVHIPLRSLCRLFRDALKPLPLWTSFPHPNFPTLNGLMNKLNEMYAALPGIVWEVPTSLETLVVGMKVRAVKYAADECEYATIQKVNENETFDIVFDDSSFGSRKNVPLNEIRIQNVSGRV
jgi:ribosomal protein L20A (L18A)